MPQGACDYEATKYWLPCKVASVCSRRSINWWYDKYPVAGWGSIYCEITDAILQAALFRFVLRLSVKHWTTRSCKNIVWQTNIFRGNIDFNASKFRVFSRKWGIGGKEAEGNVKIYIAVGLNKYCSSRHLERCWSCVKLTNQTKPIIWQNRGCVIWQVASNSANLK